MFIIPGGCTGYSQGPFGTVAKAGLSSPSAGKGVGHGLLSSVPAGRDVPALQGTAGGLLLEERCAKGPRHGAAASHPLQQARLWGEGAGEVRRRLNPFLHRINPCPEFLWLCQPPERKLLTAASLGKGRGVCQGRSLLGTAWDCLKHPCASSANAGSQPTASPAWCRGASSFTAGSGLLFLQPTSTMTPMVPGWSTEPHPAERCRGTVSTCVHNKPTTTNRGAPNLPLAEKPHEEEEEDERKC